MDGKLTKRQWRTVSLAAKGYSNAEIAAALGITPNRAGHLLWEANTLLGWKTQKQMMFQVGFAAGKASK